MGATLWLLGGLAAVCFGLSTASSENAMCGDKVMEPDDVCVTIDRDTGESDRSDQDEQRESNKVGYLIAVAGGLVAVGSGVSLFRQSRPRQGDPDAGSGPDRALLAVQRGWQFRPSDPAMIAGLEVGPISAERLARGPWDVRDVLIGEHNGFRFAIFDFCSRYRWSDRISVDVVWIVYVPGADPARLAAWFDGGGKQRFTRKPVIASYVTGNVLCGVRGGSLGRRPAEALVAGLEQMTGMAAAFRSETA
ncbi:hypothetical protein GCM10009682_02140 [Luedemannella flava]|uniref:Uncharacterized protein n=1 Tax=Luedemannella flava TaxID=349316 RepID=A0ABP4XHV3_9ACTN